MTRAAPLVALMFASSLLSCSASVSSFCTWTKVFPSSEVHISFLLRSAPGPAPSLRLYHSVWSRERALLGCVWSEDAAVTRDYWSLCAERAPRGEFSQHPGRGFDLDSLSEEQCESLSSPRVTELQGRAGRRPVRSAGDGGDGSEVRVNKRVKRGFIVPGTLWCGSGNKAPSYDDLGAFSDTDSCCREHDQCKHTILSFNSNYGVFNSNIFTMSHCDCDNKFQSCLKEANDSISSVVGYTFFNLLKMHCFKFSHRLQCSERNWFGMCKETQMALYAEVYPPTLYEWTTEDSVNSTASTLDSTASTLDSTPPALESITSEPELFTTASTPSPSSTSSSTSTSTSTSSSTSSSSSTSTSPSISTSTSSNTSPSASTPESRRNDPETEQEARILETQVMTCGAFKDLDQCENKILPQQKMYGLHNSEPRTLYHCNCTSRLFQTLSKQRRLTEVQALLMGHVSQSCFLPRDCSAGDTSCTAVVVTADLPELEPSAAVDEQRHLQAVQLKIRRPNTRRAKRKDRALRLHKLCLRMIRPRQTSRKRGQNAQRLAATRGRVLV